MTANQRRPGFRLPWSSEMGEGADEGMPGADAEGTATAAPEAGSTTAAGATERAAAAATQGGEGTPAPEPPAGQAEPVPGGDQPPADGFLRGLVVAMRKVADEAREAGVNELKGEADEQVRRLEADAEKRREELRIRTEQDVAEVGEWAKAENERIAKEAEQRVAARRAKLDQELAGDHQRTEAETGAVRERVSEYERELDAYYAQLLQMNDPAAFAAAAKRMPAPPSLNPAGAPTRPAPSVPAPSEPAGPPAEAAMAAPAPAPEAAAAPAPETAAAEAPEAAAAPAPEAAAVVAPSADAGTPVEPVQPAPTNGVPDEPAAEVHPAEEEVLAARLAQLDATLPPAAAEGAAAPGAEAAASGDATTTEVVVKGLGSFGAITGFRQALSGVSGIDGVALSLGQTGEFVFRATHASGFDVRTAIAQLEGDGAKIEDRPEGGLRVTLEKAR